MKHPLDAATFQALVGTDAETTDKLSAYLELLTKWNARINLVARGTLADPWRRHVFDSAQLVPFLPSNGIRLLDLGSGAGFPGLVLALMADADVHLIESDARKCAFLNEAKRITGAAVTVHAHRIEAFAPHSADVVTARACAPLSKLLGFGMNLLRPTGYCVFLKGRSIEMELTESMKTWQMRVERFPSRSDPSGTIVKVSNLARHHDH